MSKKLFKEFNSVSSKAWKQKIQVDLKGADYNDTLIWKTNEDVNVKPFYHQDDFEEISPLNIPANTFKIAQSIFVADVKKSNKKAINAIKKGAESIFFSLPDKDISIEELLQNIDTTTTSIHFELQFADSEFIKQFESLSKDSKIYLHTDIIGHLAKSGNWFSNLNDDHTYLEKAVETSAHLNSSLSVDLSLYQNAGATITQQLAYGLAHANEYLNHFKADLKNPIVFNLSVGTNYFFEIAKIRALKTLWNTLASEYNISTHCHIFIKPTKRNKTLYDYNTNMLRTTTECMSAILGGGNTICNLPYDAIYHKDNEFGERIARNQLLILKNESYFNAVSNASDGSYYIESLTQQLAEKALDVFKTIEAGGGFLNQLKEGIIQKKIKESANKEQKQFDAGELVLLGTNKHPNPNDKMKEELEIYPFLKINVRKTLIEPILEKRLSETIEQNRLKSE